jgi:deoxyribose-phosphate aldolase
MLGVGGEQAFPVGREGAGAGLALFSDLTRSEMSLRRFLQGLPGVDQVGAEARAASLATRSIKRESKLWAIDTAISMLDLTTLEGADTPGKVVSLCGKARRPDPADPTVPPVAAVCVYSDLVALVKQALQGSPVKVASVATAFPSGRASLSVKLAEVAEAVAAGADEVDMVIDRGAFLAGRYGQVLEEVQAVKQACGAAELKVILETGELATYDNVRRASWIAIIGGADFIKTSTGKLSPSATLPVALVMLEAVRDFADISGRAVGVKVAGGIRAAKEAIRYPAPFPHRCLKPAKRPLDAAPEAKNWCLRRLAGLQRRVGDKWLLLSSFMHRRPSSAP